MTQDTVVNDNGGCVTLCKCQVTAGIQVHSGGNVLLRRETAADREAIRGVHDAAFRRLDASGVEVAEARLVDALRRGGELLSALSIVAVAEGDIVGHVACSRGTVGPSSVHWWAWDLSGGAGSGSGRVSAAH